MCYSDYQKVTSEILKGSHVRVTAEAVLESGGRIDINIAEVTPWAENEVTDEISDDVFKKYYEKIRLEEITLTSIDL